MARSPYQLPEEIIFPDDQADMRLDAALKQVFSSLSLREIRRLLAKCHIRLNGQKALKGTLVRAGDRLELKPHPEPGPAQASADPARALPAEPLPSLPDDDFAPDWGQGPACVQIIRQSEDYVALYKPAGLHSVELKNRGGDSLEELLAETWRERFPCRPLLLNRLDLLTSGIVLAALNPQAAERYQELEDRRAVSKTYYALVQGLVSEELTLRAALDMDSRIKTRVLDREDPDSCRHTKVRPYRVFSGAEAAFLAERLGLASGSEQFSLLQVNIQRGARHQIRAHLAAAGCPIVGDNLYGQAAGPIMYLHHAEIRLPDFAAVCAAPWPEPLPTVLGGGFRALLPE